MNKIHVAIMCKSWGLTDKILTGEKKIESRWYLNRCRPWNNINDNDTIYFKDSGSPIKLQAEVDHVLWFDNLTPNKVSEILNSYGSDDGISTDKISDYYEKFKDKKYCILIFLRDVKSVKPFEIDKTGFGSMSAWITVNDIEKIKK
ncbi:MAG: hypothetical protein Q8P83_01100 [bacterium]|nr:hypothetical protein [bacterium]